MVNTKNPSIIHRINRLPNVRIMTGFHVYTHTNINIDADPHLDMQNWVHWIRTLSACKPVEHFTETNTNTESGLHGLSDSLLDNGPGCANQSVVPA